MRGLLQHALTTLRLNFRYRQAIIFGYVMPIIWLVIFGSVFGSRQQPLMNEMGQLLVLSILGGACFGLPITLVTERERGIWRRYRLLPGASGTLVVSTMTARFVLVGSSVLLQIILAWMWYRTPLPDHPGQLVLAYGFVAFAFMGIGLTIAMVASTTQAVQGLGQAIFMPMLVLGGVGVPLRLLPEKLQHVSAFMPGRYAIEVMDGCIRGDGLGALGFNLVALAVIGTAGCVAGAKLFRWDTGQRLRWRERAWVLAALGAWLAVGLTAEVTGRVKPVIKVDSQKMSAQELEDWIAAIDYNLLTPDEAVIIPVPPLEGLDERGQNHMADVRARLSRWIPASEPNVTQLVVNLLSVAGVADISKDEYEGEIATLMFDEIQKRVPREELRYSLATIVMMIRRQQAGGPPEFAILTSLREMGLEYAVHPDEARERMHDYALKLLGRLEGKLPLAPFGAPPATRPAF